MSDTLPIIYIGPNSPKLGLARFHQYIALNSQVQDAIAMYPALNLLFVPLDQFGTRAAAVFADKDASINHAILSLTNAGVF
jgi:hypothetical protein